jgi:hypothetical protein
MLPNVQPVWGAIGFAMRGKKPMRESPSTSTCLPPEIGLRISFRILYSENPAVEAGSTICA